MAGSGAEAATCSQGNGKAPPLGSKQGMPGPGQLVYVQMRSSGYCDAVGERRSGETE